MVRTETTKLRKERFGGGQTNYTAGIPMQPLPIKAAGPKPQPS